MQLPARRLHGFLLGAATLAVSASVALGGQSAAPASASATIAEKLDAAADHPTGP
jgi:leucyl aminopeptidase